MKESSILMVLQDYDIQLIWRIAYVDKVISEMKGLI